MVKIRSPSTCCRSGATASWLPGPRERLQLAPAAFHRPAEGLHGADLVGLPAHLDREDGPLGRGGEGGALGMQAGGRVEGEHLAGLAPAQRDREHAQVPALRAGHEHVLARRGERQEAGGAGQRARGGVDGRDNREDEREQDEGLGRRRPRDLMGETSASMLSGSPA